MAEINLQVLPVLPLKNMVLFPGLLMPLSVGRASSLAAVEAALATESKEIALFSQRDSSVEVPTQDDLYTIGTKAVIRKMSRPNENALELLVLGMERVTLVKLDASEPFLQARAPLFLWRNRMCRRTWAGYWPAMKTRCAWRTSWRRCSA
jgi:ATP-dependent Lon protease